MKVYALFAQVVQIRPFAAKSSRQLSLHMGWDTVGSEPSVLSSVGRVHRNGG